VGHRALGASGVEIDVDDECVFCVDLCLGDGRAIRSQNATAAEEVVSPLASDNGAIDEPDCVFGLHA
jgi:hypothetical protein